MCHWFGDPSPKPAFSTSKAQQNPRSHLEWTVFTPRLRLLSSTVLHPSTLEPLPICCRAACHPPPSHPLLTLAFLAWPAGGNYVQLADSDLLPSARATLKRYTRFALYPAQARRAVPSRKWGVRSAPAVRPTHKIRLLMQARGGRMAAELLIIAGDLESGSSVHRFFVMMAAPRNASKTKLGCPNFSGLQTAIYPVRASANVTGTLTRNAGQVQRTADAGLLPNWRRLG